MAVKLEEKRAETRIAPEKYHSVEFEVPESDCLHQFKLWNVSSRGSCLLVRDDSNVLKRIDVGDIFGMKFYPADLSQPPEMLKTKIIHITPETQGRFKGHHLVGLVVLKKQS